MTFAAFTLPAPISTNVLWKPIIRYVRVKGKAMRPTPGMVRTEAYEAWINAAGYMLNGQHVKPVQGPYAMTICVVRGPKIDLGNAEKSVSDLIQKHGIIENDRLAQKIVIEWADADQFDGAGMSVMIVPTNEKHS